MRLVTVRLTEKCKSHAMTSEGAGGMKFINSLVELLKRLLDYRYTVCVCVCSHACHVLVMCSLLILFLFNREVHRGDEYRDLHMHVVFNLLVRVHSVFLLLPPPLPPSFPPSLSLCFMCYFSLRIFTSPSGERRSTLDTFTVSQNFTSKPITG